LTNSRYPRKLQERGKKWVGNRRQDEETRKIKKQGIFAGGECLGKEKRFVGPGGNQRVRSLTTKKATGESEGTKSKTGREKGRGEL